MTEEDYVLDLETVKEENVKISYNETSKEMIVSYSCPYCQANASYDVINDKPALVGEDDDGTQYGLIHCNVCDKLLAIEWVPVINEIELAGWNVDKVYYQ